MVGGAIVWTLVALVALVLSAAYHLQLDFAGVVAVETVTSLLDQEIQGSIEIGEIDNASYEKVVASAVVFRDPEGREVIRADRVAAWPNWGALLSGVIYVDRVRLRGGQVTLYASGTEEEPTVSILVLAAGTGGRNPGPLISALTGKYYSRIQIPITIVPGTLTNEDIDVLT